MAKEDYTVVIAEDEELLLCDLAEKIQKLELNFTVLGCAQTGTKAWELVKTLKPDLLITDIRMPVMDGLALLEKVTAQYPMTQTIVISGFSDFEYARSAIRLGVGAYLLKPVDTEELRHELCSLRSRLQAKAFDESEALAGGMTPDAAAEALHTYLLENFSEEVNLADVAAAYHYSPSYLAAAFQQKYEVSPTKYSIALRIQKAQRLLAHNPELSVRQIGEKVGYPEPGYFSRVFKKQTGFSPLDYRDIVRNNGMESI